MISTYQFVSVTADGPVLSLELNRAPLNVLNIPMMQEMNAALARMLGDHEAKVVVIRAAGKAFSAGVDIADHTSDKVDVMMHEFHRIFELLHRFTVPTVAVVDGAALGGGCEVAIGCDMIVASERAKFAQPEIKVGVFPPIAAALLPRLIGRNRTLEFLLSGDTLSALEAERIGLVIRVFPAEGFDGHVSGFLARFTVQSRVILELAKRAVDGKHFRPIQEIEEASAIYMGEMMATQDAQEGLKAFLEKRQPVWSNQ